MLIRHALVITGVACAVVIAGGAARAQTPRPASPTPVPTPVAFSAQAHANVTATAQGNTFTGSAQLGIAQRDQLTRIDVLSLTSDSFPLPPITATAVIDRRANTVTIWSDTTKLYRVQSFIPRPAASATARAATPVPRASASPRPRTVAGSPFRNLEVLDVSLRLTGHTTTAGLPTTGLALDLRVKNKGDKDTSHVTATTQIADEFLTFPVTLDVSIEPGMAPFAAKLSYAVDSLTRTAPDSARFAIPAGYKEAPSLLAVLFPQRRAVRPQPARRSQPPASPMPSPSASP